ncbi:MAG: hypothetical protein E7446_00460 [Ruminococcaceae bacterium]|nr:hypothetical protein [Oscillospiraceae bacterium]
MITGEYSINAKLLYGLLLNRTMLSQKSGWVSEDGNVYVIYTIKQMADDLNRSERTVKIALNELQNAGLITRIRQGWNRANRIFLHLPDGVQISSPPEGKSCPMEVQEPSHCIGQKQPPSKTDQEYKDMTQNEEGELRRLGQYQNVFLSKSQLSSLARDYPYQYEKYINRLSSYMESNGKQYTSHYATICRWIDEDSRLAKNYDSEYTDKGDCL